MTALVITSTRGKMRRGNLLCANHCTKSGTHRILVCGYPLDPTGGYFCTTCTNLLKRMWDEALA